MTSHFCFFIKLNRNFSIQQNTYQIINTILL